MRLSKINRFSKRRSSRYVLLCQHKARTGTVDCPYSSGLICVASITHLALRSPMFGETCICFFFVNFNGIDDFAGGFTSKVDYRNSSNIMFKLSMLQKAPKRRSPNTFNYKLK